MGTPTHGKIEEWQALWCPVWVKSDFQLSDKKMPVYFLTILETQQVVWTECQQIAVS
jgi:hypothetical protein